MRGIGKGKMWIGRGVSFAVLLVVALFMLAAWAGTDTQAEQTRGTMTKMVAAKNPCNPCAVKNPCNPCAVKNPCNPCAVKNPCNPCGGGGKVDPKTVSRPAGVEPYAGDQMKLVAEGERLWQDRSLGTSGLACGTCHLNYGNLSKTFLKPYPHNVAMPQQQAGLKQVNADEMVQFCMVVPMAGKPLGWASRELAALTAYTEKVQKDFVKAAAANPCLLKQVSGNPCNPCAAKNPCNPCAAKNPCSYKKN